MPPERDSSIRPVVWLLAGFMVASIGIAVWALSGGATSHGAEGAVAGERGDRRSTGHRSRWGESASHAQWGPARGDAGAGAADPQVAAFERSWRHVGDAGPGGRGPTFSPTTHLGVLRSIEGDSPVAAGARCEVRLLPVLSSLFNCVVRVACDDVVLYPDEAQEAGYAPCDVSDGIALGALDTSSTHEDGDPAVEVDVVQRRVHVADEGPGRAPFAADIGLLRPI